VGYNLRKQKSVMMFWTRSKVVHQKEKSLISWTMGGEFGGGLEGEFLETSSWVRQCVSDLD
jgi:hypothetical protein